MQQMAVEAKEAEQRAQEARVLASRELMAAVAESNNALAATKRMAHEQEAEVERQIVEYQRQRDLREQVLLPIAAQSCMSLWGVEALDSGDVVVVRGGGQVYGCTMVDESASWSSPLR